LFDTFKQNMTYRYDYVTKLRDPANEPYMRAFFRAIGKPFVKPTIWRIGISLLKGWWEIPRVSREAERMFTTLASASEARASKLLKDLKGVTGTSASPWSDVPPCQCDACRAERGELVDLRGVTGTVN
jgi:hypothetical protein